VHREGRHGLHQWRISLTFDISNVSSNLWGILFSEHRKPQRLLSSDCPKRKETSTYEIFTFTPSSPNKKKWTIPPTDVNVTSEPLAVQLFFSFFFFSRQYMRSTQTDSPSKVERSLLKINARLFFFPLFFSYRKTFERKWYKNERAQRTGKDCQQSCSPSNSHFGRRNINSRNTKRSNVCWMHINTWRVHVVYANELYEGPKGTTGWR